jgi:hypothetical protein
MDTTTVQTIIKMIDNQLADYKERMSAKGFDMDRMETPVQGELTKLKDHLQQYIEGQLNAEENKTVE